jgi:hypothetical protein
LFVFVCSETGFCLRLQMDPTKVAPKERVSVSGETVVVLSYLPEGHGFDSRRDHLIFCFVFNLSNSSSRTTALGLTQPLTGMSTRNILEE